jgi:predicted PurR-regulated permease PerM
VVDETRALRLTTRSIVAAVAAFGAAMLLLRIAAAAERVIGWMLVAVAVAGLLHPLLVRLSRWLPRGLAAVLIALGGLGVIGFVAYGVVEDVSAATKALRREAPLAAQRLEESERFGELARSVELRDRVDTFVAKVPERLRGGPPAEAFRAATTRGVAFLTTSVLTLFLLLHGPELVHAAFAQLHDEGRRERWEHVARVAYRRGFGYARGTLLMAVLAGWLAFGLCYSAGIPGAAALAVWVGLWDVVPLVGAVVGAAPIVGLAAADSPRKALLLAAIIVAYQVFEDVGLERRLEQKTMRLGPFLTVAAGLAGLELRGATGALLGVLVAAFVAAVLDEAIPQAQPV